MSLPSRFLSWGLCKEDDPFPNSSLTCLLESPEKEPTLQVPIIEPLYGERCCFQSLLLPLSQSPEKISPPPPLPVPLMRPLWRENPVSRAFFYISFSPPIKEHSLQVSLPDIPYRETLRFQSLLLPSLKVPVKGIPPPPKPGSPDGVHIEREMPICTAFFYICLRVPGQRAPDYNKISPFSQSPWQKRPSSMLPTVPLWLFKSLLLHISLPRETKSLFLAHRSQPQYPILSHSLLQARQTLGHL
jgi:hypothetical protein